MSAVAQTTICAASSASLKQPFKCKHCIGERQLHVPSRHSRSTDRRQPSRHSGQPLEKFGHCGCHWHTACVQATELQPLARHLQPTGRPLCFPAVQQQGAGRLCVGAGKRHTLAGRGLTSSDLPASPACLLSCTSSSSSGSPASTAAAYLFVLLAACACWASKAGAGGAARPSPPWTAAATTGCQAPGRLVPTPAINGQ